MAQHRGELEGDDVAGSAAAPEVIGSCVFDGVEEQERGGSSSSSKAAAPPASSILDPSTVRDFVNMLRVGVQFVFYNKNIDTVDEEESEEAESKEQLITRAFKKSAAEDGAVLMDKFMQMLFIAGNETATLPYAWVFGAVFVAAQLSSLALTGESFFGVLTGGIVESIREGQGQLIRVHIAGGVLMWSIAFIQIVFRKLRKAPYAIVHRVLGRTMLASWFFVMGPSCFILSLITSIGPHKRHFAMTMFAIMSMDTTMFATFWYWRAWRVVRERARGQASFAVHGRAMKLGLMFTMTILMQRPLQFAFIAVRKAIVSLASAVPPSWETLAMVVDFLTSSVLDHHVILSSTTFVTGGFVLMFMMDGPRSAAAAALCWAPGEDQREAFGAEPSKTELWLWRSRYLLFLALRAMVTNCWTVDPITGLP